MFFQHFSRTPTAKYKKKRKEKDLPTYLPYFFGNRYRKQTIFFLGPIGVRRFNLFKCSQWPKAAWLAKALLGKYLRFQSEHYQDNFNYLVTNSFFLGLIIIQSVNKSKWLYMEKLLIIKWFIQKCYLDLKYFEGNLEIQKGSSVCGYAGFHKELFTRFNSK